MTSISSGENPRVRRWRRLTRDGSLRRREMSVLVEGAHLVAACIDAGVTIKTLILSSSGSRQREFTALAMRSGKNPVMLADSVFHLIANTETPAGIAAEIALPCVQEELRAAASCVFLDGVQESGNVGAILRSACAFGIRHAVLGRGCADAWSPKVLRAGMGAHFVMNIHDAGDLAAAIANFGGKIACTVPQGGIALAGADLSGRIGWLLGAEGQGVSHALAECATLKITIPMPGGAQSLNVAAAAAICFYAFSTRDARS